MTMERHAVTFSMRDNQLHDCFLRNRIEPEPAVGTGASVDHNVLQ